VAVIGLQQASVWGWNSVGTWGCLVVGLVLLAAFVRVELRTEHPLVPMRLFQNRAFAVDNAVLFLLSICFVPLFFFASLYAQVSLGESAENAGLLLLVFFGGFTAGAQWGGRILDNRGARPTVVLGCAVAAVGFYLWGSKLDALSFDKQWPFLAIAGAGVGAVLGPVSTDALNRASRTAYGAVTGITQTVRNFGGSLGMAVLGSLLITETTRRVVSTLGHYGVPSGQAHQIAREISGAGGAGSGRGRASHAVTHALQLDFAHAIQIVVYGMAGAMAVAFIVALVRMPAGKVVEESVDEPEATPVEPSGVVA
jgi:predicted MFS family arabinose efflux permease